MEAVIFIGIQATGKSSFYRERFSDTHVRINLDMLKTRAREKVLLEACLLARQPFALTDIEPYQILVPPPGAVILPSVERLLTSHGVTDLKDDIETVSNAFGRRYTLGTDAVWIISEGVVADDVAEGQLATLPIDTSETTGPVGLTMRSGETMSYAAQMLVAAIRLVARDLGEAGGTEAPRAGA